MVEYLQIPSRYRHIDRVHLRYAAWDLSAVELVDARTDRRLCELLPLDKSAHGDGRRRALAEPGVVARTAPATPMAPLVQQHLAEYSATGLPAAFVPLHPDEDLS